MLGLYPPWLCMGIARFVRKSATTRSGVSRRASGVCLEMRGTRLRNRDGAVGEVTEGEETDDIRKAKELRNRKLGLSFPLEKHDTLKTKVRE